MKKRISVLLVLVLLAFSAGCTGSREPSAQIAATTLPVYTFTSRLCEGTGLSVTRLVTEKISCLHDYTLQVSQMKAIEASDTVVISGAGLESFLTDALCSADDIIDASENIPLLKGGHHHHHEEGHEEAEEHEESHAGHHHEHDPHIWLAPENAILMSGNICQGLSARYPEHTDTFEKNLKGLVKDLQDLQEYGEQQLADLSCRDLITFHDGFSYFAQAFDLHILKSIEEEAGSEASAKDLIELITLAEEHHLPAVFTEANGSVSAANVLSVEVGCKLCTLSMAMSGDDYFAAMYQNIDTIKEALG